MAGPIRISILANAAQAKAELNDVSSRFGGLGKAAKLGGLAVAAGLAGAGIAAAGFAKSAVTSASNAQQSLGATEQVFGRFSDTVIKRSNEAAQAVGLSANSYRELSNVLGAGLAGAGIPIAKVSTLTGDLTSRASDLAATFGGSTADAVSAIGSMMRGEADPIERYGISIKAADVTARLAAQGLSGLTGEAKKQAEMQARVELLMQKSAKSSGAFAKESNTLAGQQQRLSAQFENVKAKVGTALLPVLTKLLSLVNTKLGPAFNALVGFVKPLVDRVRDFIDGLGQGSGQASVFTTAIGKVGPIVSKIAEIFTTQILPILQTFAAFVVQQLVPAVLQIWQSVASKLQPILTTLVDVFQTSVLPTVQKVLDRFAEWQPTIQKVVLVVVKIIGKLYEFAATVLGKVIPPLLKFVGFVLEKGVPAILNLIEVVAKIVGFLVDLGVKFFNAGKDAVEFARKVGEKVGDAVAFFTGLPGKVLDAVKGFGTLLYNAGRDLVQGLLDGIGSLIGKVKDAITDGVKGLGSLVGLGRASVDVTATQAYIGNGAGSFSNGTQQLVLSSEQISDIERGRKLVLQMKAFERAGGVLA